MNRSGPGELTLVAVALVGIAAYTALAGSVYGEETLAAVGVFAGVLFIAGVIWPWVALSRVRVDATAPLDATAGDRVSLQLRIRGRVSRLEVRLLDPAGEWRRCTSPSDGELLHFASRRGVFRFVRVEIRSAAPLGVFQRRRVLTVPLDRPIAVGPRPSRETAALQVLPGGDASAPLPAVASLAGDAVRAVRPYVPGDPARYVHWPTSARRGELVVREQEPAVVRGAALVVDLRSEEPSAAEEAASRAAGIANATLAAGGRVLLSTVEAGNAVIAPVHDRRAVGRRLAAATTSPFAPAPNRPPAGWPVVEVSA